MPEKESIKEALSHTLLSHTHAHTHTYIHATPRICFLCEICPSLVVVQMARTVVSKHILRTDIYGIGSFFSSISVQHSTCLLDQHTHGTLSIYVHLYICMSCLHRPLKIIPHSSNLGVNSHLAQRARRDAEIPHDHEGRGEWTTGKPAHKELHRLLGHVRTLCW